jgi:chaperonin GroES
VLRIEAAYTLDGARMGGPEGEERVVGFKRWIPYTKYEFLPDLKGRFHSIGFGHLLDQMNEVVNTAINQLIDAGHAQIAGGGFVSAGLRLQGAGKATTLRMRPGEYKVVNAPPGQLQGSIYEKTTPNPSPVMFQILDLMLGAARDITSTKDVLTGEASSASAPVGTTLALIEQGLQVFSSIYKRIYRGLKHEFKVFYESVASYGDADDYLNVVDDPQADFAADFSQEGKDVLPVSDPSVSTKMQAMGKAQMLMGLMGKGGNDRAILKRALDAFEVDDPEELLPPLTSPPNPAMMAKAKRDDAAAEKDQASALKTKVEATEIVARNMFPVLGGVPGLAGSPADAMGPGGPEPAFAGPEGGLA